MKLFVYEMISAGGLGNDTPPSLRAEGWAMLAALVEDFDRVVGVETCTLISSSCPAQVGHCCRLVPPEAEPGAFREIVTHADAVLLIAPEFDEHLARRTRLVQDMGKTILGSNVAAIELTGDKWALAHHLADKGVPTPPTILLDETVDLQRLESSFPAVCKPRNGAGSQATFSVDLGTHSRHPAPRSETQARRASEGMLAPLACASGLCGDATHADLASCWAKALAEMPGTDFLLQPLVPGLPASVTFLVGPGQRMALEPTGQILSRDGRFRYLGGRLPVPSPQARRAKNLAERAVTTVEGLAGFVGVDLVLGEAEDGSEDSVIEINPRPTTSYIGLRQRAEDNLAGALLQLARGDRIPAIRWRRGPVEFASAVSRR